MQISFSGVDNFKAPKIGDNSAQYPEAFSGLPCKAATKSDMKNAGGCDDAQTREWHFYDINNFL